MNSDHCLFVVVGRSYNQETNRHRYTRAVANTRMVYSATEWRRLAKRLRTVTPFDEQQAAPAQPPAKKMKLRHELAPAENVIDVSASGDEIKPKVGKREVPKVSKKRPEPEENPDVKVANLLLEEVDSMSKHTESGIEILPEDKDYFVDSDEKCKRIRNMG